MWTTLSTMMLSTSKEMSRRLRKGKIQIATVLSSRFIKEDTEAQTGQDDGRRDDTITDAVSLVLAN